MKIIERIHNVETGEISDVERELTPEELNALKESKAIAKAEEAESQARMAARKEILDRIGLTEEEARVLLG